MEKKKRNGKLEFTYTKATSGKICEANAEGCGIHVSREVSLNDQNFVEPKKICKNINCSNKAREILQEEYNKEKKKAEGGKQKIHQIEVTTNLY
ncbi:MAG: hypothetical protein NTY12_01280 [Candidatus Falkowbacteria bacterium]|nr:hypothetical protein [Candidatus Falkowbacteria bacterium]